VYKGKIFNTNTARPSVGIRRGGTTNKKKRTGKSLLGERGSIKREKKKIGG